MELKGQTQPTEPNSVIEEIRAHMDKLDRVSEIVSAIDSMRKVVGLQNRGRIQQAGQQQPVG